MSTDSMIETPAMELVARELDWAATTPNARLVLTLPFQEGKTTAVVEALARASQRNPGVRNAYVSYSTAHARTVADMLNRGRGADVVGWGMGQAIGGAAVYGLCVIDDPHPVYPHFATEQSRAHTAKISDWCDTVLSTRLGPTASLAVVMSRRSPDDLAGRLIEQGEARVVNIPALAAEGVPDALAGVEGARDPYGWLVSTRGRAVEHWHDVRRMTTPRAFAALYQGAPYPDEAS